MAQEVKPFKTIEEQIAILEDRGLILIVMKKMIHDEEVWNTFAARLVALTTLMRQPLFRISYHRKL